MFQVKSSEPFKILVPLLFEFSKIFPKPKKNKDFFVWLLPDFLEWPFWFFLIFLPKLGFLLFYGFFSFLSNVSVRYMRCSPPASLSLVSGCKESYNGQLWVDSNTNTHNHKIQSTDEIIRSIIYIFGRIVPYLPLSSNALISSMINSTVIGDLLLSSWGK